MFFVVSFGVNVIDLMLQPLQIQIVYNLVVPFAMCLYESFESNALNVPSNVYIITKCGIEVRKNKHSLVFPTEKFILVATSNCFSLHKSV